MALVEAAGAVAVHHVEADLAPPLVAGALGHRREEPRADPAPAGGGRHEEPVHQKRARLDGALVDLQGRGAPEPAEGAVDRSQVGVAARQQPPGAGLDPRDAEEPVRAVRGRDRVPRVERALDEGQRARARAERQAELRAERLPEERRDLRAMMWREAGADGHAHSPNEP